VRGRCFSPDVKLGLAALSTVLVLGLGACSMRKLPSLGGPATDQPQEMDCTALNAEKPRLLAARDDLTTPFLPSKTQDST
jgi:hypothetical protein